MMNKFYVYALIDPRTNEFFYIGKGSGDRAYFHVREVNHSTKSNPLKTNIIKTILNEGLNVLVKILHSDLSEEAAYLLESQEIQKYGRRDIGTGPLSNMNDGGIGRVNAVCSKEHSEKISKALTGKKRPDISKLNSSRNGDMWIERRETGWKISDEAREKIRNSSTGRTHTKEAKDKIAVANSTRVVSQATKDKISKARSSQVGVQTRSEETKEKMRAAWVLRKQRKMESKDGDNKLQ